MAKWISPREQRERETAKLVAQYRPVARQATAELTTDWQTVPDGASNLIYKAVKAALIEAGLDGDYRNEAAYAALATLQNEYEKPWQVKWQQQKRAAEKAAEAAVDVNRPVVAQCDGASRIGEPVVLRDGSTQRVLVCISTSRGFDDELGDTEWYSELAEPTEAEQATAEYQRLAEQVAAENAHEAALIEQQRTRREAELQAIRDQGREPTLFENLFAGIDDD